MKFLCNISFNLISTELLRLNHPLNTEFPVGWSIFGILSHHRYHIVNKWSYIHKSYFFPLVSYQIYSIKTVQIEKKRRQRIFLVSENLQSRYESYINDTFLVFFKQKFHLLSIFFLIVSELHLSKRYGNRLDLVCLKNVNKTVRMLKKQLVCVSKIRKSMVIEFGETLSFWPIPVLYLFLDREGIRKS